MVFAKTSKCASRISNQIREGRFRRSYLASSSWSSKNRTEILTDYLLKDHKTNTVSVVDENKRCKKAITEYEIVDEIRVLVLLKSIYIRGDRIKYVFSLQISDILIW